jgi:hypothetical protein
MRTKLILLVVTGLSVLVAPARGADTQRWIATPLTGNLHIFQEIPVCSNVEFDTPVTGGRIEIAPADGFALGPTKVFTFTRMSVFFQGFHLHVSCLGTEDDETFSEVGASLARAVTFTATAGSPGLYHFTIPKELFLVQQSAVVQRNSDPVGPESGLKRPAEDVTGYIDLNVAKVHLRVRMATSLHFEFGLISEDRPGSQTAEIDGAITFPDTDGDSVSDFTDNCRFTANPLQNVIATPVVTAPPSLTLNSCLDPNFGRAAAADVCNGRAVTVTHNAPLQFAIGPNTVTWSGNDGVDPVVQASQTVTVVDTTDPFFTSVPADIALNNCQATPLGTPTATDDCAGTVTFTNNGPPSYYVGTTVVTWTARDVSSNTQTATQNVTVTDTVAPTVSCVATGPPTGHAFTVSSIDACGAPVIRLGSYVLADGETIKINETGQSGVRLIGEVQNRTRHFHVGKGQAVITATDGSGNVTTVVCR